MQTVCCSVQPISPPKSAFKLKVFSVFTHSSPLKPAGTISRRVSAVKAALPFNYNSSFSVFPAEACETVGGVACAANMFPEVKLSQPFGKNTRVIEDVHREYFDYESEPNSVLRDEACDDLGGEFCIASYK